MKTTFVKQEFWIQIKGFSLEFMTREMERIIGEDLGEYVLTDQSRKHEQFGSYIRVRVAIDVTNPLRRYMTVHLPLCNRKSVKVDFRYENLPNVCLCCGVFNHVEEEYERGRKGVDDKFKPYGLWFQMDIFGPDN